MTNRKDLATEPAYRVSYVNGASNGGAGMLSPCGVTSPLASGSREDYIYYENETLSNEGCTAGILDDGRHQDTVSFLGTQVSDMSSTSHITGIGCRSSGCSAEVCA